MSEIPKSRAIFTSFLVPTILTHYTSNHIGCVIFLTLYDHNENVSFAEKNNVILIDFPHFLLVKPVVVCFVYTFEIYIFILKTMFSLKPFSEIVIFLSISGLFAALFYSRTLFVILFLQFTFFS